MNNEFYQNILARRTIRKYKETLPNINDLKLIAVVMKGSTSQKRFDDAKTLLDYGFANFSNKVLVTKGAEVSKIEIEKANKKEVTVVAEDDLIALVNKGDEKDIRTEVIFNKNITAPLEYLEVIGVQKCYLNDELIGEVNLVTNEKIERKSMLNFISLLIEQVGRLGRKQSI